MSPLDQIALGWQALVRSFVLMLRPRLWVPVLGVALVETAAVLALWGHAHPAFSPWVGPWLERAGGEAILHYPNVLHALPRLLATPRIVIVATVGALAWGAATVLFAAVFRRAATGAGGALAAGARRAPTLILTQLPLAALIVAAAIGLQQVLRPGTAGGLRALALAIALPLVVASLRAAFLHLPAVVMLEGRGARGAFAELPRIWSRGYLGALVVALATLVPALPVSLLATHPALAARFGPEAAVIVALAQVAASAVSTFLMWGAATVTYLGSVMEFDEWDPA